ncbi:MAG: threonine synthase, partial [Oscillospiraceae bacterium]
YCTSSPSMDILISSNLDSILFDLNNSNSEITTSLMSELSKNGKYTVSDDVFTKISELFDAGFCDDDATKTTINETFKKYNYLCDTHTAVALKVFEEYKAKTGDKTPTVIASTANPYKFSNNVLASLTDDIKAKDEFSMVDELFAISNEPVPEQLSELKGKKSRFNKVAKKEDMAKVVFEMLKI